MTEPILIRVPGEPISQGSHKIVPAAGPRCPHCKSFARYRIAEGSSKRWHLLKRWREAIAAAALREFGCLIACKGWPVTLSIEFVHPTRKQDRLKTREWRCPPKTTKPDIDKLLRAVLDGLTGVAYVDDAQVVRVKDLHKRYGSDQDVGAWIWVSWEET